MKPELEAYLKIGVDNVSINFIERVVGQTIKKLEKKEKRRLTPKERNKIRAHFLTIFEEIWESDEHEEEE